MPNKLPMIRQAEASECGIACLAMIAAHYGHQVDLIGMRQRYAASIRGLTLHGIITAAQRLQLTSRAVRLEMEDLKDLRRPSILHWKMSHFVVLRTVKRRGIVIHDPAAGVRFVKWVEVDRCFTGIALEVWPTVDFKISDERDPVRISEMMGNVSDYRRLLARPLLLAFVVEMLTLASPLLFQHIVDRTILAHRDTVTAAVAGIFFLGVFEVWGALARDLSTINLGNRMSVAWQTKLLVHLVRLPIAYFENRSTADILSRFDATEAVRTTITGAFTSVAFAGVVSVLALGAMYYYDRRLATIVAVGALLYAAVRHFTLPWLRERALHQASEDAKVRNHLIETLYGIRTLKLFDQESARTSRWMNYLIDAINARSSVEGLKYWINAASSTVIRVELAVIIGLGAVAVIHEKMSVGALFAFLAYKDHFNANVMAFINNIYDVGTLSVQLNRIGDITRERAEPPAISSPSAGESILRPVSIEMSSVWFRYSESDPWIIKDASLFIAPGECVAITGRSGAGKSTLLKLVCGLLVPTLGEVRIDGHQVTGSRRINKKALGMTLQEDVLFCGTIAENIHFFSDEPDLDRVRECARLAAIDREVAAMPMAYESYVGVAGAGLSGGQRQRVLIARALYRNPGLLIFDESTSHLDLATERAISDSLSNLTMTRVIVAHRLETISIAEKVLILEDGRLVARRHEFRAHSPEAERTNRSVSLMNEDAAICRNLN